MSSATFLGKKFHINNFRRVYLKLIEYLKEKDLQESIIEKRLEDMGAEIVQEYLDHWKIDSQMEQRIFEGDWIFAVKVLLKQILDKNVDIEPQMDENETEKSGGRSFSGFDGKTSKCPFCHQAYSTIGIGGCYQLIGIVKKALEIWVSKGAKLPTINDATVISSKNKGDKVCQWKFQFHHSYPSQE